MPLPLDRRDRAILAAILLGSAVILVFGWRLFWFITDDAYISFRYISNSMQGHGYVWNPPPLRPVEGYTNFLWMLLLELVWRAFKVEPPQSANYMSLAFTFAAMLLTSLFCLRLKWSEALHKFRPYFIALVLAGLVTNRTILAWSSSGLETAFFNFFFLLWIYCALFRPFGSRYWGLFLMLVAVIAYLIRPDGLLILVSTLAILLVAFGRKGSKPQRSLLLWLAPVVVVILHLAWRRHTYGEWLPNTYFAKYVGIWPESGIRYLLSFILEYALWVWLGVALWTLIRRVVKKRAGRSEPRSNTEERADGRPGLARTSRRIFYVVTATVLIHMTYYTVMIGGDHFEYRVYSHLPYLIMISFVWMINSLNLKRTTAFVLLTAFVICSLPVQWSHWAYTRHLDTREETNRLHIELADHWPRPVRLYAKAFDGLQYWLIEHYVCVRHQEHKINYEYIESLFPSREVGSAIRSDGYPVFAFPAVGVVSWTLPHINIIDLHGLNDYVIARNPRPGTRMRMMAHDRRAPSGYVDCLRPNVELQTKKVVVILEREHELTADDIVECELKWADIVKRR